MLGALRCHILSTLDERVHVEYLSIFRAAESARLEEHIDLDTGEIDYVRWQEACILVDERLRALVAMAKNIKATINTLKLVEEEVHGKYKRLEQKLQRLEMNLAVAMRATGTKEVIATDGSFSAKLYPDRDESVVIDEGATFPPELYLLPKPPEPSKTRIKEAILAGVPVAGARIVRRDRLTIR